MSLSRRRENEQSTTACRSATSSSGLRARDQEPPPRRLRFLGRIVTPAPREQLTGDHLQRACDRDREQGADDAPDLRTGGDADGDGERGQLDGAVVDQWNQRVV